jgi:hypothetical protein
VRLHALHRRRIGFSTLTVRHEGRQRSPAASDTVRQHQHNRLRLRRQLRRLSAVGTTSLTATPTWHGAEWRRRLNGPASTARVRWDIRQRCDARHALQIPARARRLRAGEVTAGASRALQDLAGPHQAGASGPASIAAAQSPQVRFPGLLTREASGPPSGSA